MFSCSHHKATSQESQDLNAITFGFTICNPHLHYHHHHHQQYHLNMGRIGAVAKIVYIMFRKHFMTCFLIIWFLNFIFSTALVGLNVLLNDVRLRKMGRNILHHFWDTCKLSPDNKQCVQVLYHS